MNFTVTYALKVLANLIQKNISVKLVLHQCPDYPELLAKLVNYVRHPKASLSALQLLVFLVLNTDKEEEFFAESNLHSTLEIIFGHLSMNGLNSDVLEKCISFLTKLMQSVDIISSLENFSQLEQSLCTLLEIYCGEVTNITALSLELLCVLLESQQIQKIILYILERKPELSEKLLSDVFSQSLDVQIISRRLLRSILTSKHSGLDAQSRGGFAASVLGHQEFTGKVIRCLCSQIRETSRNLSHTFAVSKTSKNQSALRELIELINILCHAREFRRRFSSGLGGEDVETLLNRDNLCNFTSLTFPLINLLFKLRKELPTIQEKFLQLVTPSSLISKPQVVRLKTWSSSQSVENACVPTSTTRLGRRCGF